MSPAPSILWEPDVQGQPGSPLPATTVHLTHFGPIWAPSEIKKKKQRHTVPKVVLTVSTTGDCHRALGVEGSQPASSLFPPRTVTGLAPQRSCRRVGGRLCVVCRVSDAPPGGIEDEASQPGWGWRGGTAPRQLGRAMHGQALGRGVWWG